MRDLSMSLLNSFVIYSRQEVHVIAGVCLSVCLSVCLFACLSVLATSHENY